uniref:Uncharacterized protein n=1 Tax=uncultured Desulfobacterium sp. TaxID=201089 RepID=E1YII8_9BACT|nr:unknown protein [uncultured Desulfobacterium sp.]
MPGKKIDYKRRGRIYSINSRKSASGSILKNKLPELKGFSERNIGRMIAFFRAYPGMHEILPQAVAQMLETNDSQNLHQL